jgi:predicted nucleic acid-binding protein
MSLVLDNSVAMLWLLPQSNPAGIGLAEKVLSHLSQAEALVPSLWRLEASNVIAKSLRLKKITQAQASTFISLLDDLSIQTDDQTDQRALHDTLDLARRFGLSAYDAAYLELALRKTMPIATLDDGLVKAATEAGVRIID